MDLHWGMLFVFVLFVFYFVLLLIHDALVSSGDVLTVAVALLTYLRVL